jgi:hypothetical protein
MFFYTILEKIERLSKSQQQQLYDFIVDVIKIPYVKVSDGIEILIKDVDQCKIKELEKVIDDLLDNSPGTNLNQEKHEENENENEPVNISLSVLRDKIYDLSYIEHEEILKFLSSKYVSYSQNNNGYFVCLNSLEPRTLKELDALTNFYLENKAILNQRNIQMQKVNKKENSNTLNQKENNIANKDLSFIDDLSFSRKLIPNKNTKSTKLSTLNEQRQQRRSAQLNAASEHAAQLGSNGAPLDQVKLEVQKYINLKKRYMRPWPISRYDEIDENDEIIFDNEE